MKLKRRIKDHTTATLTRKGTKLEASFCGEYKFVIVHIVAGGDDWEDDLIDLFDGWSKMEWHVVVCHNHGVFKEAP